MPRICYNHTFPARNRNKVFGWGCSFEDDYRSRGDRFSVHKAKIMAPWENINAVVKVPLTNTAAAEVDAEMQKNVFAKKVLGCCPEAGNKVILVDTYQSEIDKMGKGSKLKRTLGLDNRQSHSAREGVPVVVQNLVRGNVTDLISMKKMQNSAHATPAYLLELVHRSYKLSNGTEVIAGMKGVTVRHKGQIKTLVTSLVVHSTSKKYGQKDLGQAGIKMYEAWSGQSLRPCRPTAPPSSLCGSWTVPPSSYRGLPAVTPFTVNAPLRVDLSFLRFGNMNLGDDHTDGHTEQAKVSNLILLNNVHQWMGLPPPYSPTPE